MMMRILYTHNNNVDIKHLFRYNFFLFVPC